MCLRGDGGGGVGSQRNGVVDQFELSGCRNINVSTYALPDALHIGMNFESA